MSRNRYSSGRQWPGLAIVGGLMVAGAMAIVLSLVPRGGGASAKGSTVTPYSPTSEVDSVSVAKDFDALDQTNNASVRRASASAAPPPPSQQQSGPPLRLPAPAEAQPAVQVRALGVSSGATKPASAPPSADAFSVAVVTDDAPGLADLGTQVVQQLTQKGIKAKASALADAGRPDALVVLGTNGDRSAASWFCDPGADGSTTLSRDLLDAVTTLPPDPAGKATLSTQPSSDFPCDDVSAGRARVAASLLELPAGVLTRPDDSAAAATDLASGLSRYFSENASAVRSARSTTRLIWPARGPITSFYGPSHPLGIDIGQSSGNIVAATDGTVQFAGGDPCCSYGLYVIIDSPSGIRTLYAHFSALGVTKGQRVVQGQTLGKEGSTGHSTGPHLHFEVLDHGVREDPMKYLP